MRAILGPGIMVIVALGGYMRVWDIEGRGYIEGIGGVRGIGFRESIFTIFHPNIGVAHLPYAPSAYRAVSSSAQRSVGI